MQPKYSVGETVVLQSQALPQYNGVYRIKNVYMPGQMDICQAGGEIIFISPYGFTYNLGFSVEWMGGVVSCFQESALRKKHEPSQMSFQSLIQSINSPVKQES